MTLTAIEVIDRHLDSILRFPSGHGEAFGVEVLILTLLEIRGEILGVDLPTDDKNGVSRGRLRQYLHTVLPDKAGPLPLAFYLKKVTPEQENMRHDILVARALVKILEPYIKTAREEQDAASRIQS